MQVYKFGGSVLRDTAGVRAAVQRMKDAGTALVVVVSAFGKTTHALEELAALAYSDKKVIPDKREQLREYHLQIVRDLPGDGEEGLRRVEDLFAS